MTTRTDDLGLDSMKKEEAYQHRNDQDTSFVNSDGNQQTAPAGARQMDIL